MIYTYARAKTGSTGEYFQENNKLLKFKTKKQCVEYCRIKFNLSDEDDVSKFVLFFYTYEK